MSRPFHSVQFRWARRIAISGMVMILLTNGCSRSGNEYVAPPPPEVTFALPIVAPITPFVDENGLTEAAHEADVRARVGGFLRTIEFEPGQKVKQGDVLYTIERDQYEAAVESAQAKVKTAIAAIAVAEAQVKIAEAEVVKTTQDLAREEKLKSQNASSQAQYDAAVAAANAAIAAVESAQSNVLAANSQKLQADAALRQAELDLGYTVVQAVIDGRITKTNFKVGNLVENGSGLATIVDDSQVFANFSVSDREVLRLMNARKTNVISEIEQSERQWRDLPVFMAREGDLGYPFEGRLNYIDQSGVEADTGTLGLRAIFDNPDGELLPGLFVSLRVPAGKATSSLLIPERSILRDQVGPLLLTIDADNKIVRTRIETGQAVNGWAIVTGGLEPTTRVVVDGLQFARPGGEVVPVEVVFDVDPQLLLRGMVDPDRAIMDTETSRDVSSGASADASTDSTPIDSNGDETK